MLLRLRRKDLEHIILESPHETQSWSRIIHSFIYLPNKLCLVYLPRKILRQPMLCTISARIFSSSKRHLLLVDPVVLGGLPGDNLTLLEPESDLLLGVLNAVGTVAHIPTHIKGEVATDCAWEGGKWVGSTEDSWDTLAEVYLAGWGQHTTSSLDGITSFPNHGADGSAVHVY